MKTKPMRLKQQGAINWLDVGIEPNAEAYYLLACHDDVFLDIYKYRPAGMDGNSTGYFRSVNDNSTMDIYEVSHYSELKLDPPDWANLTPKD